MRSVHSRDLKHHAFVDGFGLTRVSLPDKVKTERRVCAGLDATLSVDAGGRALLACHEGEHEMHHLGLPALRARTRLDRGRVLGASLTPEGGFVDVMTDGRATPRATLRRWSDPFVTPAFLPLDPASAPTRPGVTLDDAGPSHRPARLVTSPRGTWATLLGASPTLLVGDLEAPVGRLRWSAPVRVPPGALLTLHPFDEGRVVVAAFLPAAQRVMILRFDAEGEAAPVVELSTRGPAAPLTPEVVLHQRDDGTVVRRALSDGVEERTRLPDSACGPGRVFGQGSSAFFLPWHAETVIDLRRGLELDRGLGEHDAPARRALRRVISQANALAQATGSYFELERAQADRRRRVVVVGLQSSPGDESLLGVMLSSWVEQAAPREVSRADPGWRAAPVGGLVRRYPHERWDEVEVAAALARLAREGLALEGCLAGLAEAYRFDGDGAPTRCAFTEDGARHLLGALVELLPRANDARPGAPPKQHARPRARRARRGGPGGRGGGARRRRPDARRPALGAGGSCARRAGPGARRGAVPHVVGAAAGLRREAALGGALAAPRAPRRRRGRGDPASRLRREPERELSGRSRAALTSPHLESGPSWSTRRPRRERTGAMLYALDVDYRDDGSARAALVGFARWDDPAPTRELVTPVADVAAYEPGAFYKRELPCLLAALREAAEPASCVVVDGHVWLRRDDDAGLGAHLWRALGCATPVVGVAKQRFDAGVAAPVLRGASERPLWVTAAGVEAAWACARLREMHGDHRIPTLLKRVDALCRGAR
ncbi:MAG: endonuclease V [Polyangiales bacterium]